MNMPRVDTDLLPPLHIPLRFFLLAPLFALLALSSLVVAGPGVWITRWHPTLLGVTHLLVLGVLSMVMIGALAQVVPVLAVRALLGARKLLPIVHVLLAIGVLFLASALGWSRPQLLWAAIPLLLLAFLITASLLGMALFWKSSGTGPVTSMRLAILAMVVTVSMGIWLALGMLIPSTISVSKVLTDVHAAWGLLGWAGLLILGVGSQVIPMFHVTPVFSTTIVKSLNFGFSLALLFFAGSYVQDSVQHQWLWLAGSILSGGCLLFLSVYGLKLLSGRRRKISDATVNAWRSAIVMLMLAIVILALRHLPVVSPFLKVQLFLSAIILLIFGVLLQIVTGMLMKIVPFLAWTHLQNKCGMNVEALSRLPHMHNFISTKHARTLVLTNGCGALLLALAPHFAVFHWLGCLVLIGAQLTLFSLLAKSWRLYMREETKLKST